AAGNPGWAAGRADREPRHQRRPQVLDPRRVVAAHPDERDRGARAHLRRGPQPGGPRRAARRRRATRPRSRLGGASILDDPTVFARYDLSGMATRVGRLGPQLRDGWAQTRRLTLPPPYHQASAVAVLGMGGSAIGADLVRAIFADRLTVPLVVVRDYVLPASAGPTTLV